MYNTFDDFITDYATKLKTQGLTSRKTSREEYKKELIELTQQFYSMPMTNVFSTNPEFKQYPFWIIGEILTEVFGMNPPIMDKYSPEIVEWSYALRPDRSAEYSYGRRWNEWNQILNTISILSQRQDSKRAVMPIFMPHDTEPSRKDVPCTLLYDFKIRDNKIDMTTMFRSHDFLRGVKYDFFLSSFMAQLVAMGVNANTGSEIEPGRLYVYDGSLHVYGQDEHKLDKILSATVSEAQSFNLMHPYKSVNDIYGDLIHVKKGEESTYYGNFEHAQVYHDKIENPVFKDFLAIFHNRNAKFNGLERRIQLITDTFRR